MNDRLVLSTLGAFALIAASLAAAPDALGQSRGSADKGWTAPKTPWGEPDLQG